MIFFFYKFCKNLFITLFMKYCVFLFKNNQNNPNHPNEYQKSKQKTNKTEKFQNKANEAKLLQNKIKEIIKQPTIKH